MTVVVDRARMRLPIMNPGDMGRAPLRPTRHLLDMFSMMATGHLPWGVGWCEDGEGWMPLSGGRFLMCCNHTLAKRRGLELVEAGLCRLGREVQEGDEIGRPALYLTDLGRQWLADNWSPQRRGRR